MSAQLMRLIPFLRSSGFGLTQTISADTSNYNLRTAALAAGWDGAAPLIANITIDSGIVVYSTSTSTYAFDVGTTAYPDGSSLALTSLGYIVGMGGAGGSASGGANPGSPGGPALRIIASLPTTIDNTSGTIGGGGGGGASSGYDRGGGGGRSGRTNSAGGYGFSGSGSPGTFTSGGAGAGGAAGGTTGPGTNGSGPGGGGGGGWGASGGSAGNGVYAGGGGGAAVVGNAYITWTDTGLRYGSIT